MRTSVKTQPKPITVGQVVFETLKEVSFRRDNETVKRTNRFTVTNNGDGYTETETCDDEPGFKVERRVQKEEVKVLHTGNLMVVATPSAPRKRNYGVSNYVYYYWDYAITATVGGLPVEFTMIDLKRFGRLADDVTNGLDLDFKAY